LFNEQFLPAGITQGRKDDAREKRERKEADHNSHLRDRLYSGGKQKGHKPTI